MLGGLLTVPAYSRYADQYALSKHVHSCLWEERHSDRCLRGHSYQWKLNLNCWPDKQIFWVASGQNLMSLESNLTLESANSLHFTSDLLSLEKVCCLWDFNILFCFSPTVQGILVCPELWHLNRWQVHCDGLWWQEGHCVWSDLLEQTWIGARSCPTTVKTSSTTFPHTDSMDVAYSPRADGQEVWQCQTEMDVGTVLVLDAVTFHTHTACTLVHQVLVPRH